MITRGKTRLLLFGLLGFFTLVAFVQWMGAGESTPELERPSTSASPAIPGSNEPTGADTPADLLAFDNVLLLYADGLSHVAGRYFEAGGYETAELLLKRVLRVRNSVLAPDHPSVVEAQLRYSEVRQVLDRTAEDGELEGQR